jgi:hypothetical protein
MSLSDKGLEPKVILEYIVSKNILDKKTMFKAFQDFSNKKIDDKDLSFSQYLVDKRLMLDSTILNVLNEIKGVPVKEKKVSKSDVLLDQDVFQMQSELEKSLQGKEKALTELIEPKEEDIQKFLSDNGVEWQGRRMSQEDKESLIRKMAQLQSNPEVSKTNGVFVLNWMEDLLGT